jgi:hypothetical protein
MHEKASKRTSRLTDYRRHGAARDAASRLSHRCSPPPPARARARRCGAEAQTRRAERAHLHRREQEAGSRKVSRCTHVCRCKGQIGGQWLSQRAIDLMGSSVIGP